MRLKIELVSNNRVILPTGFNEYIQAFIYNHLNAVDSRWLHEKGFNFEKRKFRLFTFSWILERGRFDKGSKTFNFPQNISFYLSSPVEWILEQLAQNIIKSEFVVIGENRLTVSSISVMGVQNIDSDSIRVRAITPIEVHSTFTLGNGKKKTHYYTPFENEFNELINANIKKKWKALHRDECAYELSIKPLFNGNRNEKIVYFGAGDKKTVIRGWKGNYKLESEPQLLKFAVDAGIGSRNSQGFGMVEVVG